MYVLLTNSNSLRSICNESVAFGWPRVEHYSGGLTLYPPDGGEDRARCVQEELRVWLKQLPSTPTANTSVSSCGHTWIPLIFIPPLVGCLGATFNTTDPTREAACGPEEMFVLFFFECNKTFKFNHRHVTSTVVNVWGLFFFFFFFFSFCLCILESWNSFKTL